MNLIQTFFIIALLSYSSGMNGQPKAILQVIGCTGLQVQNGSHQVSSTLGEPVTATQSGGGSKITQGFHQDMQILVKVATDNPNPVPDLRIYPNPVHDALMVESGHVFEKHIHIQLMSIQGQFLLDREISTGHLKEEFHMDQYTPGTYIIQVSSEGLLTTATIVKQ